MASSTTTGRFSIAPRPRIATLGWLITGKPKSPPNTPGLVIENVLSCTSSGFSFFDRARSARSFMARAMPRKFFSSAFLITGTISPQSSATAMPMLHFLVQHDVRAVHRGVHGGKRAQRLHCRAHEERHERELRSGGLLELGLSIFARRWRCAVTSTSSTE